MLVLRVSTEIQTFTCSHLAQFSDCVSVTAAEMRVHLGSPTHGPQSPLKKSADSTVDTELQNPSMWFWLSLQAYL